MARKGEQVSGQEDAPSRSAKKRESAALQKLGEELAKLKPEDRAGIELPADLLEALDQYGRMPDHESRRRQRQFIGRLMRELAPETVQNLEGVIKK